MADHFTRLAKANPNKNQTARKIEKKVSAHLLFIMEFLNAFIFSREEVLRDIKVYLKHIVNFWNMKTWYHPRRIVVSVIWLLVLATFSAFDSAWFSFPELCHLIWTINKIISQIFFQRIPTTLVCYLYVGVVLRQFIFSLLQDFSGVLNSTNFQIIVC